MTFIFEGQPPQNNGHLGSRYINAFLDVNYIYYTHRKFHVDGIDTFMHR